MTRTPARLARLGAYALARAADRVPPLPMNLTVSVTRRCDSRCTTCGIWCMDEALVDGELTLAEWERLFESVGPGYVWFLNVSGGEPTLRPDLPEIVAAGVRHLEPDHVHLPTNGIDPDRILAAVTRILDALEDGPVVLSVKPSLDGIGDLHDRIRGVPGNFERVMETTRRLLDLRGRRPGRMEVGLGTVVSRRNLDATAEVVRLAESLGVDSVIHEIAENRQEMGNEDWGITPSAAEYGGAAAPFEAPLERRVAGGSPSVSLRAALRLRMIDLTRQWLQGGRAPLPCWAGITNAHVGPRGGLWACAVQARTHRMADLRLLDMDLRAAWGRESAREVRRNIRAGGCRCPLANQLYANILMHPLEMGRALAVVARARMGRSGR